MVTLQDIEQREAELQEVEEKAAKISRTPIPQRRYGVGVTTQAQQQVIARRREARGVITEVRAQKQQLETLRPVVRAEQERQAEIARIRGRQAEFERGRRLAIEDKPPFFLSKEAQKGYRVGRSELAVAAQRKEYFTQLKQYESQGLRPVIGPQGKVVGFEDVQRQQSITLETIPSLPSSDVSRYEKAGVVERVKTTKLPMSELPSLKRIKEKAGTPYKTLRTAETYPELFSVAYRKVPFKVKQQISRGIEKGKRGITSIGTRLEFPLKEVKRTIIGGVTTLEKEDIIPTREQTRATMETPAGKEALESVQFLTLGAIFTPAGIGAKTTKVIYPLRERQKAYATEIIQTKVYEGKPIRLSDYTIFVEKEAPRIQIETSLLRESIGIKPKVKYLPPIKSEIRTPFKATIDEPFITLETKGARVGKISEVTGVSRAFDLPSYKQLPPTEKFLVRRLAEQKTGGVPVAEKYLFNILKREDLRFLSDIDVEKLGKFKLGTKFKPSMVEVTPKGRRITRFQTITETKPIKETDFYELSKSKIIFKDVTKPLGRARGKTLELDVYTLEKLEPQILTDEPIKFISPADIKKTPFQKTFQVQQPKTLIKTPPPELPPIKTTQEIIPSPSTQLKPTSSFVGTGLYERTEGGQIPGIEPGVKTLPLEVPSYRVVQLPQVIPLSRVLPKEITKTIPKLTPKEITKGISKEITKAIPKLTPKEITKQISKQTQKQTQKQISKVIPKPAPKLTPGPGLGYPRIQKTPGTRVPIPLGVPGDKQMAKEVTGFRPFVIKKGKKVYIGGALPKGKALRKAEEEAKRTLRATFGVDPISTKVLDKDIVYTPSKKLFRPFRIKEGKKIPLKDVYIQKLGKRLASRGEVTEIHKFKRIKL